MDRARPFFGLPISSLLRLVTVKLALGVFLLIFLLGYQPTFGYPPLKRAAVRAQEQKEMVQTINTGTLPIVFQLPHPGFLSTYFSRWHPGIDIATGLGMPIKPVAKGKVLEAGYNFWGLGLIVRVEHPEGYSSLYAHMGKIYVKSGQEVAETDLLGEVGLTGNTSGPHTHFELTKNGNYVDPLPILPQLNNFPTAEALIVPSQGGKLQP